jgi:hypothetical protein
MADLQPDSPATDEAHNPWEALDGAEEAAGLQDAEVVDADVSEVDASNVAPTERDPVPVTRFTSNPAPELDTEISAPERSTGGWTITALCMGLALLACAVLIPQADANRRLAYERQTLQNDLETVEKQIAVNQEFIRHVGQDPTLAERLARRQMKLIPVGNKVLELPADSGEATMSPFQLTAVARPEPLPAYKPIGGFIAGLCYDSRARLYLVGTALGMVAVGLVLGGSAKE